jgi:hypothetical protein
MKTDLEEVIIFERLSILSLAAPIILSKQWPNATVGIQVKNFDKFIVII